MSGPQITPGARPSLDALRSGFQKAAQALGGHQYAQAEPVARRQGGFSDLAARLGAGIQSLGQRLVMAVAPHSPRADRICAQAYRDMNATAGDLIKALSGPERSSAQGVSEAVARAAQAMAPLLARGSRPQDVMAACLGVAVKDLSLQEVTLLRANLRQLPALAGLGFERDVLRPLEQALKLQLDTLAARERIDQTVMQLVKVPASAGEARNECLAIINLASNLEALQDLAPQEKLPDKTVDAIKKAFSSLPLSDLNQRELRTLHDALKALSIPGRDQRISAELCSRRASKPFTANTEACAQGYLTTMTEYIKNPSDSAEEDPRISAGMRKDLARANYFNGDTLNWKKALLDFVSLPDGGPEKEAALKGAVDQLLALAGDDLQLLESFSKVGEQRAIHPLLAMRMEKGNEMTHDGKLMIAPGEQRLTGNHFTVTQDAEGSLLLGIDSTTDFIDQVQLLGDEQATNLDPDESFIHLRVQLRITRDGVSFVRPPEYAYNFKPMSAAS